MLVARCLVNSPLDERRDRGRRQHQQDKSQHDGGQPDAASGDHKQPDGQKCGSDYSEQQEVSRAGHSRTGARSRCDQLCAASSVVLSPGGAALDLIWHVVYAACG